MTIPNTPNPIDLFKIWYDEYQAAAANAGVAEPTAVTLATVDPDGQPWTRVVLLKGVDDRGFTVFTNTRSNKGRHLANNPRAALNFYWPQTGKQVRVLGTATPVTPAEADDYFASRARGSQLGAWASHQSDTLRDRADLERRLHEVETQYANQPVPRPPHWSGYRIAPTLIEFWLNGPNRLHHRREYHRDATGNWTHRLLNP